MFLNYLALALLIIGAVLVFYTFVYIHDLPHKLAKRRGHPHAEAIGIACWLSLLTFHVIWPIVFIWAMTKQDTSLISMEGVEPGPQDKSVDVGLAQKLEGLEQRIEKLEATR